MKRFPILLAAALAFLCSCNIDTEPILYRGSMMGFLSEDGSFKGDDGRFYTFSNVESSIDWQGAERLMVVFDALAELSENHYSARLLAYDFPLYKKPVVAVSEEDYQKLGTDPISFNDGWYSGGCLNMINSFCYSDSGISHTVNLLVKEFPIVSDTLKVKLMHNAAGDTTMMPVEDDLSNIFTFYSSFPLGDYLPDDKAVVLEIEWEWDGQTHLEYRTIKKQ